MHGQFKGKIGLYGKVLPSRQIVQSTQVVYLAHANMHTNHLLVYNAMNHECICYNYYVTLPCTDCTWAKTKQFKLYSRMMSLYLHLILGLKGNVYIML